MQLRWCINNICINIECALLNWKMFYYVFFLFLHFVWRSFGVLLSGCFLFFKPERAKRMVKSTTYINQVMWNSAQLTHWLGCTHSSHDVWSFQIIPINYLFVFDMCAHSYYAFIRSPLILLEINFRNFFYLYCENFLNLYLKYYICFDLNT